jgi:putative redox protein
VITTTSLQSAYRTEFTSAQAHAIADAPPEKGGSGSGFGPHELLEAALATCINMAIRMRAVELEIAIEGVSTVVRLNRSRPDVAAFEFATEIAGAISASQRRQLEEAAGNCPVRQTLSRRLEFVSTKPIASL